MRILYDGEIYRKQAAGGINRYFANLINRLPSDHIPTVTTYELRNVNYPTHPNLKTFSYRLGFRPRRISYKFAKYYFRLLAYTKKFDLFHPTYYSLLTEQEMDSYRSPTVITVYDMIHEMFYPDYPDIQDKHKALLAAQAIICISENTKKDLLERYSLPENKITVTHLAAEIDISFSYGSETVPDHPYYLYVGGRYEYKNFDGLLRAFAKVASVNSEVKLCVVGSQFNETEQQLLAELKLSDRIEHYGHADDKHLAKLYRSSVAFVYPSLYEGFGIPPLEAMSCGTVAIASNTSSIPEVVGDGGILFDPKSTDDLADILLHLLDNPLERDRFIKKGFERAKVFSWDKTAAQTLEVYRSLCN